jgi:DinB superfamily
MMKQQWIITALEKNAFVFQALLSGIEPNKIHWRPADDKWNMLEIVCHLLDEEQYDFRARIKHVLENPLLPMPSINPTVWVQEKNYASMDYKKTLKSFLIERTQSVNYLHSLHNANWQTLHHHPKLGDVNAAYFLHNWLAHDYLHMRQVNRYDYLYLKENSGIDLRYAGDW